MRTFNNRARATTHVVSRTISIAWAPSEIAFCLDLTRRTQLNRFDRDVGEQLWTTHEFADAILPRVTRLL